MSQFVKLFHTFFDPPSPSNLSPIVILHGLFGSSRNWNTLSRSLAHSTGRSCWAVDLRNHGQSPHGLPMTWDLMAADLRNFLRENQIKRPVLLGHSLGGQVLMQSMARDPGLDASALIAVDIAPRPLQWPGSTLQVLLHALQQINAAGYGHRKEAEEHLRAFESNEQIVQFLLSTLRKTAAGMQVQLPLEALDAGMTELSQTMIFPEHPVYPGPSLFLHGEQSDYLREDRDGATIKLLFPAARLVQVSNAGHWLHFEKPVEFVQTVAAFLGKE